MVEGDVLWRPSEDRIARSNLTRYLAWLRDERGRSFDGYGDLWVWSVDDLQGFWSSIADSFDVHWHRRPDAVLPDRRMPGAAWFPGGELNYAEHALALRDEGVAVVFGDEAGTGGSLSRAELVRRVGAAAAGLARLGVRRGDRVAAFVSNRPEALVAFLATASLGAIWSSCSPEFGTRAVTDRFRQIEPTVLIAVDGYRYGGKDYDRLPVLAEIRRALPTLGATVMVPSLREELGPAELDGATTWDELLSEPAEPDPVPVPFEHPLWILYSSGTTGLPKAIVQGHGGILLEHLKSLGLHCDLGPEDRFFWFTTTGWMMWNFLVSGLLLGTEVLLYDGSAGHPDLGALWRFAEATGMTYFGTSAPYLHACMKAGLHPRELADLSALRSIGSTGAPLSPEGFRWVYEAIGGDLLLGSISGGTDLCTAFVGSCPLLPVREGEIQCRCLGAKVEALGPDGTPVVGEVGELALTAPMPSMPTALWHDPDGSRYRESYFETFPGVWRHGDWLTVTEHGGCIIYGRSDATLNRGGVRIGTAEFYRVVDGFPEVRESLVVDTGALGREGRLYLFVALAEGAVLDDGLRARIASELRRQLSPRHVPDQVIAVPEIPKTLNGKRMEVPVKRILSGVPVEEAASPGAMADPDAIRPFVELAGRLAAEDAGAGGADEGSLRPS